MPLLPKGISKRTRGAAADPDSLQASPLRAGPHAPDRQPPAPQTRGQKISDALAFLLSAVLSPYIVIPVGTLYVVWARSRLQPEQFLAVAGRFAVIFDVFAGFIYSLRHLARHHHRRSRHGAHAARRAVRGGHRRQFVRCRRAARDGRAAQRVGLERGVGGQRIGDAFNYQLHQNLDSRRGLIGHNSGRLDARTAKLPAKSFAF